MVRREMKAQSKDRRGKCSEKIRETGRERVRERDTTPPNGTI
jgi:hypothetical protein